MSTSPISLPCLAFHSVVDRSTILFSSSEKKPIAGRDIGQLENMTICPTTYGFMLARDPTTLATFLWSTQSRGKIELPPLGLEVDDDLLVDCTCLLSCKPTAPDCVVLLVEPDSPFIWYCRAGDSKWEEHEYDIGTQALPDWEPPEEKVVICPIAACRGKFYFNGTPRPASASLTSAASLQSSAPSPLTIPWTRNMDTRMFGLKISCWNLMMSSTWYVCCLPVSPSRTVEPPSSGWIS
ncbi:hypothetical protein ACQ4PT_043217 [Festuca glaucescens]